MKKMRFFPIAATLLVAGGVECFLDKGDSISGKSVITLDDVSNIEDINVTNNTTSTTFYQTTFTTETTILTTTTENIYKDIMFLDGISSTYDISEVNDIIVKYSSYCDLSYDQAVSILSDGFDINSYNSLEDAIMRTLFDKGCDLGFISTYCVDGSKKNREMTRDEQESIMLDMCDVMGIPNDYKKIVLAIFRWETGNGTSYLCVENNNYGAIKIGKNFGVYQTPEFGMYRAIKCIYGHIIKSNNKGFYDINSVVSDMSYRYCFDTASDWTNHVLGMVSNVSDYYDFDGNQYTKKYEN